MKRLSPLLLRHCGNLAVIIYVTTVIAGGLLFPHYSHFSDAISELTGSHSPIRNVLNPFFLIYNVFLALFAYGLFNTWIDKRTKAAAMLIMVTAVASIFMWRFPMDSKGYTVTSDGIIHIVLASIESVCTILATILAGLGVRRYSKRIALASFLLSLIIAVTGISAGILTAQNSPISGLFERVTIGTFLLWVLLVARIKPE